MFRVVNGIEDGENGTTGVTNCIQQTRLAWHHPRSTISSRKHTDVLHTLAQHHLVEDLATSHADKPIHISVFAFAKPTMARIGNCIVRLIHLRPSRVNQGLDMASVFTGALEGRTRNIAGFPVVEALSQSNTGFSQVHHQEVQMAQRFHPARSNLTKIVCSTILCCLSALSQCLNPFPPHRRSQATHGGAPPTKKKPVAKRNTSGSNPESSIKQKHANRRRDKKTHGAADVVA